MGSLIEDMAKESCKQVAEAEEALSVGGAITLGIDGGWQRRGFHSASGH